MIEEDKAKLVDLVQLLGDYLVDDDGSTRAKGMLGFNIYFILLTF